MKSALRQKFLELRDLSAKKFLHDNSQIIKEKLFGLPEFQNAKNVMFYASFGSEVETIDALKEAIKNGKIVAVPCTDEKEKTMVASQIIDFGELVERNFGILEPKEKKEITPEELDIVIVPAIAFDRKGYRIGYGKGYYDRFLSKLGPNTLKIGLAFDFQVVDSLPREEHDLPVDKVITEKRVIE